MLNAEAPLVQAEVLNLIHAIAVLIKCMAFYVAIYAVKLLVVDVLKVDLGPAAEAIIGELRNHAKPPTFDAQGGNSPSEGLGQGKREV